jgi:hypothetical protein
MDETLAGMTKDQLLARRHEDEMRLAELDPQKRGNSPGSEHRDSTETCEIFE